MKKILLIIAILIASGLNIIKAQGTWTQKANFAGIARAGATSFSIGNKGYLGLGEQYPISYKDFWQYDPVADAWSQKADFGGNGRLYAVGFTIDGKGYVGTGQSGAYPNYTYYKDFWEYDPISNTWTQKSNFGGTARFGAVGFSIDGNGYLGTGTESLSIVTKDFWEYDPIQNKWTKKADFSGVERQWAVGFNIGSHGYVGTGGSTSLLKDFWEYNPSSNTWTQKSDFGGSARQVAAGFCIGNKGYIGTGETLLNSKDFWEYDPTLDTWTQKSDFGGTARNQVTGFSIGNKGYMGTGSDASYYKDFWEYTPDGCLAPSNLRIPKIADTAVLLRWALPADSISSFKLRYRVVGSAVFISRQIKSNTNHFGITGLLPNTTYQWQMKSNCTADTSGWVSGPDFTTTSSLVSSSNADAVKDKNVSVQIMPNPSKGNITVAYKSSNATNLQLNIFYITGKKVFTKTVKAITGNNTYQLALSSLATGTYYLQIINGSETKNIKFVIEK